MIPVRRKYSVERVRVPVDFANKLGVGDTLLPGALVSVAPSGDLTATVDAVDPDSITVRLAGGLDGHDYRVTVVVPTSHGDMIEEGVTIEVRGT